MLVKGVPGGRSFYAMTNLLMAALEIVLVNTDINRESSCWQQYQVTLQMKIIILSSMNGTIRGIYNLPSAHQLYQRLLEIKRLMGSNGE